MRETHVLEFAPFRLDLGDERLWQGTEAVRLTAKAFAVLRYLAAHAGHLVTKDELFAAVWNLPFVSEAALTVCIGEVRRALGDTARTPQFLETVRGRGYRFCAPVLVVPRALGQPGGGAPPPVAVRRPRFLVGREAELVQLRQWWAQAQQGERQVVFVTGEVGIGKTTLVDAFVAPEATTETLWLGRGQCIEQHGVGEAYLPLLEALTQVCRGPDGVQVVERFRQQAPTWLLQLPALLQATDIDTLQRRGGGASRERLLRELAEVVEALTAQRPLLLVLEDLHWSDSATLDWLAYVAQRRGVARLLVIGTYRPVEAMVGAYPVHTVQQDLLLHGQCAELVLGHLPIVGIAAYLAQRFGMGGLPAGLARALHQRTTGNPLFLVTVVDELVRQGVLRQSAAGWALVGAIDTAVRGIPASLRQVLERQVEQLPVVDQEVLEAASVAGREFSAAAVAAGIDCLVEEVEARCDAWARRGQFVSQCGTETWADGTVATRYEFLHDLYREMVYDRVPVSRRVRWHLMIGTRLEVGCGPHTREMASELAEHFVRGQDYGRAVPYLRQAGEQAIARSAHREAVLRYEQALQALQHLPQTPETSAQAIDFHLALRTALIPLGDPARLFTHMRAAETLAAQLDDVDRQGRIATYWTRDLGIMGQHEQAVACGQRALALIHGDVALQMTAQLYLSYEYYYLGAYQAAVMILTEALGSLGDLPPQARLGAALPAVSLRHSLVQSLAELGQFDDGSCYGQEAVRIAESVGHAFSLYQACRRLAGLYLCQGALDRAIPLLERALALCQEADLPYGIPAAVSGLGWAYAQAGRPTEALPYLEQAAQATAAYQTEGKHTMWLILLSESYLAVGRFSAAIPLAHEALTTAQDRQERGVQGYALRLLGALTAQGTEPDVAAAARYYQQAIVLAETLGMRPLQAHCHRGLGTLYLKSEQPQQARAALSAAIALYYAMDMTFWLPETEAALAQVER